MGKIGEDMHHKADKQLFRFANDMRKNPTVAELKLWEVLRGRKFKNKAHPSVGVGFEAFGQRELDGLLDAIQLSDADCAHFSDSSDDGLYQNIRSRRPCGQAYF